MVIANLTYILNQTGGGCQDEYKIIEIGVDFVAQEDIYNKLSNLETSVGKIEMKVEEHSRLLEKQQERNDIQTELNTILKLNAEQMKKFGDTLERVDTSLNNLNSQQQQLGTRMTEIEGFLSNQKFSITDVLKYIGAIIGGLIVGYISTKIG